MPFDTFTPRQKTVAMCTMAFCKARYGGNGLKIEEEIHKEIGWQPTFYLRPTRFLIVAVEVDDNLYPEALKGAAHEIGYYSSPISVYQACSLDAYQNDPKQTKINLLRKHGFGIITLDEDNKTTIQHQCIPLAQHISAEQIESELSGLNNVLKVKFKSAHDTYLTNAGQGLQQAGQLVEGLVYSIANQSARNGFVDANIVNKPLADIIDGLYETTQFKNHRAALGAARGFVKEFRNTASHAPKNPKQAADKIRNCKSGFIDAISVARKLRVVMQTFNFQVRIYTT